MLRRTPARHLAVLASRRRRVGRDKAATGQYVDLSPVAMPIVIDGHLINYVSSTSG
ncbi:MAG: hypothetical protein WDM85_01405 [Caulobacteraceae bacterium]